MSARHSLVLAALAATVIAFSACSRPSRPTVDTAHAALDSDDGDSVRLVAPDRSVPADTTQVSENLPCEQRIQPVDTIGRPEYAPVREFLALLEADARPIAAGDSSVIRFTNADTLVVFVSDAGLDHVDVNGLGRVEAGAPADTVEHLTRALLARQLHAEQGSGYYALVGLAARYVAAQQSRRSVGYCPAPNGFTAVLADGAYALTWRLERGSMRLTRIAYHNIEDE